MMFTAACLLLGVILASPLLLYAHRARSRARFVFAIALVVAAFIYVLFVVRAEEPAKWLAIEALGVVVFGVFAVLGWRGSIAWLAFGWAAHPLWDIAIHRAGPGAAFTPQWYPLACVSFDLIVAGYILYQLAHAPEVARSTATR